MINHGILDGKALHKLLRRAKVSTINLLSFGTYVLEKVELDLSFYEVVISVKAVSVKLIYPAANSVLL